MARKLSARAITRLRKANAEAIEKYNLGGVEKKKAPKPVTLPRVPSLEKPE